MKKKNNDEKKTMEGIPRRDAVIRNLLFCLSLISATSVVAEEQSAIYSPYANRDFPENVYWGDTHVHTNLSADAFFFGDRLLGPEDAYRSAKGETVVSNSGQRVRLSRPLDFIVISDHAEYLGLFAKLADDDPGLLGTTLGERWQQFVNDENGLGSVMNDFVRAITGQGRVDYDRSIDDSVWKEVVERADRQNDPGRFTAFAGYEWTSLADRNDLHRVVIYADGADKSGAMLPFSAADSTDPEDLWAFLDQYERATGGSVLAISHNGNRSNGLNFPTMRADGGPLSGEYAEVRGRWEPLYEVTQIKGDAESHPLLSPGDMFADYETWDELFPGSTQEESPTRNKADVDMLAGEYARSGLKRGLEYHRSLGVNPFKFGMIGSSDTHTAVSAIEENNFFGKVGDGEPSAKRAATTDMFSTKHYAASGVAAVWAHENTRASVFDALRRREAYATTGPRIMLRFFGGWEFTMHDANRPDYAAIGYRMGVPMGGDLAAAPTDRSPRFLIVARKDPQGANLERVQVVKGWLDAKGKAQEQVWDVVLSDGRKPKKRMAVPIRSTVDVNAATYTNTVGEAEMATVWEDPAFDAKQRAFYYVRVLEIPTPRWTTYDAAFYGTELATDVPAEHQERAYSSPIWYSP